MTENYRVGYSVDALEDLREIYNYIANSLFQKLPKLWWGISEMKFVHWISCLLVMH